MSGEGYFTVVSAILFGMATEDVTPEAWQVAQNICDSACFPEYWHVQGVVTAVQTDIARAILAAEKRGEEREREAIEALLAHGAPHSPRRYIYDNTADRRIWACDQLDDAIRARSKP